MCTSTGKRPMRAKLAGGREARAEAGLCEKRFADEAESEDDGEWV